ncbi:hypothetical protein [Achromobacter phage Motura]|uniref:Uncharacterized protein n=1 Tax=Achromobacter phage Motura TaxID=2591403 RepID=A0A514CT50_9CAUD|nr:hypothetical protein H1O15_gp091 [Achromobacter phage Motura]QDH83659.1 hypothetical protein [Achromobacter phage Motura]
MLVASIHLNITGTVYSVFTTEDGATTTTVLSDEDHFVEWVALVVPFLNRWSGAQYTCTATMIDQENYKIEVDDGT